MISYKLASLADRFGTDQPTSAPSFSPGIWVDWGTLGQVVRPYHNPLPFFFGCTVSGFPDFGLFRQKKKVITSVLPYFHDFHNEMDESRRTVPLPDSIRAPGKAPT